MVLMMDEQYDLAVSAAERDFAKLKAAMDRSQ